MRFLLVHEKISGFGHSFLAGSYDTYQNWNIFFDWCMEQYGNPYGPEARWYTIGKEITIVGETDALYVKLSWDTMEKPR